MPSLMNIREYSTLGKEKVDTYPLNICVLTDDSILNGVIENNLSNV